VIIIHSINETSLEDLNDEDALDIWARFIGERQTTKPVKDPVAFFYSTRNNTGVFSTFEYLDGVLSNTPERENADHGLDPGDFPESYYCPRCLADKQYTRVTASGDICPWCQDELRRAFGGGAA
jgi:hypothetical protein